MQKNFSHIHFLFPKLWDNEQFIDLPADEPFSDEAVAFLQGLSTELTKNIGNYPEVAALAFFCRKANIVQLKNKYVVDQKLRLGRGIVFHISPSNVPLNFAYSLVCGILSGNNNIVRVPSKNFEQINIVCNALQTIADTNEHTRITDRIVLVRYDRENKATGYFSSICDVRIIWGGDETINQVRKNELSPRAFDISFADRYSLCVINADTYVKEPAPEKIAAGFYDDTYLFDQNACTSPHLLVWLGTKENVAQSKNIFWNTLHAIVKERYNAIQPVIAVDKLTTFYAQAASSEKIHKIVTDDNTIWRINLQELPDDIDAYRCKSGYFSEYHASSLLVLRGIINRKYQTLTYFGISKDELTDFIKKVTPSGIDRIVPIGRASEFSLTWDGFELITTLSRSIEII